MNKGYEFVISFCSQLQLLLFRYKKAGDFAKAGETYKSENVRVSFSSEHVPGEFGFLEKFHYIKPTPYGHYAGMGRQHSYYDNGSNNRRYGQRYGGGYKKKYEFYKFWRQFWFLKRSLRFF